MEGNADRREISLLGAGVLSLLPEKWPHWLQRLREGVQSVRLAVCVRRCSHASIGLEKTELWNLDGARILMFTGGFAFVGGIIYLSDFFDIRL